jgi:hypothetical protein
MIVMTLSDLMSTLRLFSGGPVGVQGLSCRIESAKRLIFRCAVVSIPYRVGSLQGRVVGGQG